MNRLLSLGTGLVIGRSWWTTGWMVVWVWTMLTPLEQCPIRLSTNLRMVVVLGTLGVLYVYVQAVLKC